MNDISRRLTSVRFGQSEPRPAGAFQSSGIVFKISEQRFLCKGRIGCLEWVCATQLASCSTCSTTEVMMNALQEFDFKTEKEFRSVDDGKHSDNPVFSRAHGSFIFHGEVPLISTHEIGESMPIDQTVLLRDVQPETFATLLRSLQSTNWISDGMIEDFQSRLRGLAKEAQFDFQTDKNWPWERLYPNGELGQA